MGNSNDISSNAGQKPGNNETKKTALKYAVIVGCAVTVFAVCFLAVYLVVGGGRNKSNSNDNPSVTSGPNDLTPGDNSLAGDDKSGSEVKDSLFSAPRKTNILLLGMDQGGGLSDVIILASFDSYTGSIDFISVPRDTYVKVSQEDIKEITDSGRYIPTDGIMKMTDLHSWCGPELGHVYSKKYVEKLLGVTVDYYVELDTKAFRFIVDSVDGIYMTIRKGGLYYYDAVQGLTISLSEGYQKLNGKQAEQLVRFRHGYANADLGRIEVQHDFIKAFLEQTLQKDNIIKNLQTYLVSYLNYVKTDFDVTDLPKYIGAITNLDMEKVHFYTAPGDADHSIMYMLHDDEVAELINSTVYNYDIGLPAEQKTLKIQVLNGGCTSAEAGRIIKGLKAVGYENVSDGGNFSGSQKNETRIYVKDKKTADTIKQFFNKTSVETDKDITPGYDVLIIMGKGEK